MHTYAKEEISTPYMNADPSFHPPSTYRSSNAFSGFQGYCSQHPVSQTNLCSKPKIIKEINGCNIPFPLPTLPEELHGTVRIPILQQNNHGRFLVELTKRTPTVTNSCDDEAQKEEAEEKEEDELDLIVIKHHDQKCDFRALVALLTSCASQKDLHQGSKIHADLLGKGLLQNNVFLGNAVVNMYAKCGSIAKAQEVFDKLPFRDVVSWNVLITGYIKQGQFQEALLCFERMQNEGVVPNAFTLACILKICGTIGATDLCQDLHGKIVREGLLQKDIFLGTTLVDSYAKLGLLRKAQEVFNELPARNVVSWNALIAAYVQHGHNETALACFERMQLEGPSLNGITFICVLKACSNIGTTCKGQEIHAEIVRDGLLEQDTVVSNAVIDMYAKCGLVEEAQEVFNGISIHDIVSWNSLITGYAQWGHSEKVIRLFEQMHLNGLTPDAITFVCVLKACGDIRAKHKGQEIHANIVKEGFLEIDMIVGKALIDMYVKCGLCDKAEDLLIKLRICDVVAWNGLITEFVQQGHADRALHCFERMQVEGLFPNAITLVSILKACANIGASDKGQELHMQIMRDGLLGEDIMIGTALVDMYVKCCLLKKAHELFDKIQVRDVILWSALISGYAQQGEGEKALAYFEQMQREGIVPNAITLACILQVYGDVGAIDKGHDLHAHLVKEGLLEKDVVVGTALVTMYVKCCLLRKAQDVFDYLPARNIITWSVLIDGYAQVGMADNVFKLFDEMLIQGLTPDLVTFTTVLNTCSHIGLVDEGQMYFEVMSVKYGINPTLEHHICMIDLYCRVGFVEKALGIIKKMPFHANLSVWHTVLGACLKWGDVNFGQLVFKLATQYDNKDAGVYVSMRNIYAAAGGRRTQKAVKV